MNRIRKAVSSIVISKESGSNTLDNVFSRTLDIKDLRKYVQYVFKGGQKEGYDSPTYEFAKYNYKGGNPF